MHSDARRRWRTWWITAAGCVVVIVGAGIPVVLTSDWWNTEEHVATSSLPTVELTQPAATVGALWSADSRPASARVSTTTGVVTATAHEVVGHDPASGEARWSYRRDNADLCTWISAPTRVVAVFRNGDDCSDLTALDPAGGERRWYLNADLPGDVRFALAPSIIVAVSGPQLIGYYEETGGEAWKFDRTGCTFGDVAGGGAGLAILARCKDDDGRPTRSIIVLDSWTGDELWTAGAPGVDPRLVGVDTNVVVMSTINNEPALSTFSAKGKAIATQGATGLQVPPEQLTPGVGASQVLVSFDGSRVFGVDERGADVEWSMPATGPPAVDGDVVTVPTERGFTQVSAATGVVTDQITTDQPVPRSAQIYRLGDSIVATDAETTTVYGDRS